MDRLEGPVEGRGGLVAVLAGRVRHLLPGHEVHRRQAHPPAPDVLPQGHPRQVGEHPEAFRIVGVSVPLESDIEKNFEAVPQVWGRAAGDGTRSQTS